MMRRLFPAFIMLTLVSFSCGEAGRPADVLQPEQMQAVLWDVLQTNTYVSEFLKNDSTLNIEKEQAKLQLQVFAKHKISKKDFDKSYNWYVDHPVQMQVMMDTMIARGNRNKSTKPIQPLIKQGT